MGEEKELLARLRYYMGVDQEFYHTKFMKSASQIDNKEELIEIIDLIHANYLIRTKLFSNLARRVSQDGYKLPPLHEIMEP